MEQLLQHTYSAHRCFKIDLTLTTNQPARLVSSIVRFVFLCMYLPQMACIHLRHHCTSGSCFLVPSAIFIQIAPQRWFLSAAPFSVTYITRISTKTTRQANIYIVPLDMKGCIFHLAKWKIHHFISKGTIYDHNDKNSYSEIISMICITIKTMKYSKSNYLVHQIFAPKHPPPFMKWVHTANSSRTPKLELTSLYQKQLNYLTIKFFKVNNSPINVPSLLLILKLTNFCFNMWNVKCENT